MDEVRNDTLPQSDSALLEKHQQLEWPDEPSAAWQRVRDGAQAVAAAVVRAMQ